MSSAPAQVPVATTGALEIFLDQPNRLYRPGDAITGTVTGWDPTASPATIDILLQGRSESYLDWQSRRGYGYVNRDRCLLTNQAIRIQAAHFIDSRAARFSIGVPHRTDADTKSAAAAMGSPRSYWTHSWATQPGFHGAGGHRLPPSINLTKQENDTDALRRLSGWGHIQYVVVVAVTDTHEGKVSRTESFPEVVSITTPSASVAEFESVKGRVEAAKTEFAFNQQPPGQESSWRKSVKNIFKEPPSFSFTPTVQTPSFVPVVDVVRVSIQLHSSARESSPPLPPVSLQQVTVSLQDVAGIRCEFAVASQPGFQGLPLFRERWTTKHVFYPNEDGATYQDKPCHISFRVPESCVPTFNTYNLNVHWNVMIEAVFRGIQQEKTVEFRSEMKLIPKLMGSSAGIPKTNTMAPQSQSRVELGDVCPVELNGAPQ